MSVHVEPDKHAFPDVDRLTASARQGRDVLRVVRDGAPKTRAQLVAQTGLARSTVGAQVDSLLGANLLIPAGEAASTGGRPPVQFQFNPNSKVVLAADLGAAYATLAVTDLAGTVLRIIHQRLDITNGPKHVLDWVGVEGCSLLKEVGREGDLVGVGIGVPGPVEHSSGRPVRPPIMPGWDGFDIPVFMQQRFPVPTLVDNDVNLMALGEHTLVHGSEKHLIVVKAATGIGSGIIIDGKLHRGAQGAAGDLGHMYTPAAEGVMCRCGNTGCLEAVASGPAIASRLRNHGIEAHTAVDVVNLVESGNQDAANELRESGRMIGDTLAGCVSFLNPSIIILGGVLSRAGDHLLAGVRERVYNRSLPLATGHLLILPAWTGREAAVAGAGVMVSQRVLGTGVAAE